MYKGLVVCIGLAGLSAGFAPLFHIPAPLQWLSVLGAVISGVLAIVIDVLFGLSRYFASLATSGAPLFTLQWR
jgi:hypothetical protein